MLVRVGSPIENRNGIASVDSAAARYPARFPQIPLSVISRSQIGPKSFSACINNASQFAGNVIFAFVGAA